MIRETLAIESPRKAHHERKLAIEFPKNHKEFKSIIKSSNQSKSSIMRERLAIESQRPVKSTRPCRTNLVRVGKVRLDCRRHPATHTAVTIQSHALGGSSISETVTIHEAHCDTSSHSRNLQSLHATLHSRQRNATIQSHAL